MIEYVYLSHNKRRSTRMQGWQSARQDPAIDENSTKQEKWNSQWHETSQSMWLNYSAQNLFFTGTYGSTVLVGVCVIRLCDMYAESGFP